MAAVRHFEAGGEVAEGIPDARLEVLEDAGHFPWIWRPEDFSRLVGAFLD